MIQLNILQVLLLLLLLTGETILDLMSKNVIHKLHFLLREQSDVVCVVQLVQLCCQCPLNEFSPLCCCDLHYSIDSQEEEERLQQTAMPESSLHREASSELASMNDSAGSPFMVVPYLGCHRALFRSCFCQHCQIPSYSEMKLMKIPLIVQL